MSEISKVVAPTSIGGENKRAIQRLYDELNRIITAVNQKAQLAPTKQAEGKSGDIRLVKNADGGYSIEGRFGDGWVSTVKGALRFQQREGAVEVSPTIKTSTPGLIITGGVLENPTIDLATIQVYREVPSGTINGTNVAFTLSQAPLANTTRVRKDGLCMREGVDYTISGVNLTYVAGNGPTQWHECDYSV